MGYPCHKIMLDRENGNETNEKFLWHGTCEKNLGNICRNGLTSTCSKLTLLNIIYTTTPHRLCIEF